MAPQTIRDIPKSTKRVEHKMNCTLNLPERFHPNARVLVTYTQVYAEVGSWTEKQYEKKEHACSSPVISFVTSLGPVPQLHNSGRLTLSQKRWTNPLYNHKTLTILYTQERICALKTGTGGYLQTRRNSVNLVVADWLLRQPGATKVKYAGQDEHALCCERLKRKK